MARDYKKEYARYHSRPEQIKRRSKRTQARRVLIRKGVVRKGDGLDIDHVNGNPMDNRPSNLRPVVKRKNRSFPRTKTAGKKNPTD